MLLSFNFHFSKASLQTVQDRYDAVQSSDNNERLDSVREDDWKSWPTDEGRELLESLLLEYESHNDADDENLMRPDVPELRRKLGMHV